MYLREIQLDLPYRKKVDILKEVMRQNNCTYEEAIQLDYNENWVSDVRRRFELETRCIVDMFLRLLGKYKTNGYSKIVIDCVEREPEIHYPLNMGIAIGISLVRYELDYVNFFNKKDYEKKKMTLQIIKETLYELGKDGALDLSSVEDTINKIEELDYTNFWVCGKKAKSPNKLYTAELYIEHEIEKIDFFVIISNKQDEIVEKKLIITEKPSRWMYSQYLGKLSWVSDTEIQLKDRKGRVLLSVPL